VWWGRLPRPLTQAPLRRLPKRRPFCFRSLARRLAHLPRRGLVLPPPRLCARTYKVQSESKSQLARHVMQVHNMSCMLCACAFITYHVKYPSTVLTLSLAAFQTLRSRMGSTSLSVAALYLMSVPGIVGFPAPTAACMQSRATMRMLRIFNPSCAFMCCVLQHATTHLVQRSHLFFGELHVPPPMLYAGKVHHGQRHVEGWWRGWRGGWWARGKGSRHRWLWVLQLDLLFCDQAMLGPELVHAHGLQAPHVAPVTFQSHQCCLTSLLLLLLLLLPLLVLLLLFLAQQAQVAQCPVQAHDFQRPLVCAAPPLVVPLPWGQGLALYCGLLRQECLKHDLHRG